MQFIEQIINKCKDGTNCTKNEFAALLAHFNPKVGNQNYFSEILFNAIDTRELKIPWQTISYLDPPQNRNFKLSVEKTVTWAINKGFLLPEELHQQFFSKKSENVNEGKFSEFVLNNKGSIVNQPKKNNLSSTISEKEVKHTNRRIMINRYETIKDILDFIRTIDPKIDIKNMPGNVEDFYSFCKKFSQKIFRCGKKQFIDCCKGKKIKDGKVLCSWNGNPKSDQGYWEELFKKLKTN